MQRATEKFREHDAGATATLMEAFLLLAVNPDGVIYQSDLKTMLKIEQPSASHCVERLSGGTGAKKHKPRNGGEHLGLIEIQIDPRDARRRALRLTAAGRNLASEMGRILAGWGE